MPTYRALLIGPDAALLRAYNFEASDDSEAAEKAWVQQEECDVELWEGTRLVTRFTANV